MASNDYTTRTGHVVVCITPEAMSSVSPAGQIADGDGDAIRDALSDSRLQPLFSESQPQLRERAAYLRLRFGPTIPDLSRFYRVEASDRAAQKPEALAKQLDEAEPIEAAYFKPPHDLAWNPHHGVTEESTGAEPGLATPDFTDLQGYLGPAPAGIDAYAAWSLPGGFGEGIRIIDIESGWRFSHEDLIRNQGGVLNTAPDNLEWRNHGTAVAGILSGDLNVFGISGIAPAALIAGISVEGPYGGSSPAIRRAADRLDPGDIMLIELHIPGPVTIKLGLLQSDPTSQEGFVPLEFWPDDFAAIKYATDRGVIVVAAAGNGRGDLDQVDELVTPGTATAFASPFRRDEADSGAILVGAGASPGGDHPDRARLDFSNWGSCVDAQGWGDRVVTTGGRFDAEGDLQGGSYEDRWYTKTFNGTSSAAPMVAGALACVQGVLRAAGKAPLTPMQARALLRGTGSPQAIPRSGTPQRIGSRPNLRELIPAALAATGAEGLLDDLDGSPYGAPDGMGVTITVGRGGCEAGWGGPRWGGPRWGGPRWGGPSFGAPFRWGGPSFGAPFRWGGPSFGSLDRWGGPSWRPSVTGAIPEGFDVLSSTPAQTARRDVRRPGFSSR